MKLKSILAVALAAAAFTLASCSKEDSNPNSKDGQKTDVMLNIQQEVKTRGLGAPIGAHKVQFSSGYVVFANSANVATDVFTIVSGTPSSDPADRQLNMAEGDITFEDVSGESRNVYILGNAGTLTITPGTTNMETLVATTVTAKSQTNDPAASTVAAATLYGKTAAVINHSATPSEAAVTVAPISSRIEIAKFTAGGDVTGYQINGIFINNFYKSITLSGALNSTAGNDKFYLEKADASKFTAGGDPVYAALDAGYFYNEDKTNGLGTLNGLVCSPAAGNAWAYNVPAPKTGEFPHIIIAVTGVTGVTGLTTTDVRWMTVTKFVYDGGANDGTDVAAFEGGKIYKITDFEFDETNLDVNPEMKAVKVKVQVSLAEWEPITVKPW